MVKRSNENSQLSKEEYESREDRGGGDDVMPSGDFSKAPEEVLARRRIVRTPRTKWAQVAKEVKAASAAASASPSSSTTPQPKNPFANFSFGQPSTATTTTPTTTNATPLFGSSSTKPFAFPTTTTTTATPSTTTTGGDNGTQTDTNEPQVDAFLTRMVKDRIGHKYPIRARWKNPMEQFVSSYLELYRRNQPKSTTTTTSSNQQASKSTLFGSSSTTTANATTSTTTKPLFGSSNGSTPLFGSSTSTTTKTTTTPITNTKGSTGSLFPPTATAPAPVSFSFGATSSTSTTSSTTANKPMTSTGFLFGTPSGTAASSNPSSGFSFSFGMTPSTIAAPASSSTTTDTSANQQADDDGGATTTTSEPTGPLESADTDWELHNSTKVKLYNHRETVPKQMALGDIKLQTHKKDKTSRMVMRDTSGKVLINMSINSSMKFEKLISKPKTPGKKPTCRVVFYGLLDQDRGNEMFTLVCRLPDLDNLHETLTKLAS